MPKSVRFKKCPISLIDNKKELGKHHTTVYRAYGVARELMKGDYISEPTPNEIKNIIDIVGYETSETYVIQAFRRLEMWLLQRQQSISTMATQLRECIYKPSWSYPPDFYKFLHFKGQDWRLDPKMWFYLCIPSFRRQSDNWNKDLSSFKYLTRKNPFWKNYGALWKVVLKLEKQYQLCVLKLGSDFDEFQPSWNKLAIEKLMRERNELPRPYRRPGITEKELSAFEPNYDEDFTEAVLEKFKTVMDEIDMRHYELEELLRELSKNLESMEQE